MSTWLLLQYGLIALAVIISAWVIAKKQFPNALRKLRIAIAVPLVRENKPAWLRAIGRKIAPEVQASAGQCGDCDGCG
jgi:hypothetical protein